MLPAKCIHSWNHFMQVFFLAHHNYKYEKLCLEFDNLTIYEDETISEFLDRFMLFFYRFCHDDLHPNQVLIDNFTFLVYDFNVRIYNGHIEESSLINLDSKINPIKPSNENNNPPQRSTSEENLTSENVSIISPYVCDNETSSI